MRAPSPPANPLPSKIPQPLSIDPPPEQDWKELRDEFYLPRGLRRNKQTNAITSIPSISSKSPPITAEQVYELEFIYSLLNDEFDKELKKRLATFLRSEYKKVGENAAVAQDSKKGDLYHNYILQCESPGISIESFAESIPELYESVRWFQRIRFNVSRIGTLIAGIFENLKILQLASIGLPKLFGQFLSALVPIGCLVYGLVFLKDTLTIVWNYVWHNISIKNSWYQDDRNYRMRNYGMWTGLLAVGWALAAASGSLVLVLPIIYLFGYYRDYKRDKAQREEKINQTQAVIDGLRESINQALRCPELGFIGPSNNLSCNADEFSHHSIQAILENNTLCPPDSAKKGEFSQFIIIILPYGTRQNRAQ